MRFFLFITDTYLRGWTLAKRGANVTFHKISKAGHFVQEDQPEKIVPLLIEHWRKTEG